MTDGTGCGRRHRQANQSPALQIKDSLQIEHHGALDGWGLIGVGHGSP